jgi:sugar phosphate isomerase/epimerase
MKIAFSTIACPTWTLEEAAAKASAMGYLGVELRSFYDQSVQIGSEPFGIAPETIKSVFDDAGVSPLALATSIRYDKAINPPVIGRMCQNEEEGVSDTKAYVDLADRAGVEFVRVFGNHLPAAEPRTWSMRRVSERLKLAAQTARNTEVRVLIENAGSFANSAALLELVEIVDSQWLEVSFNTIASLQTGECPLDGIKALGDRVKVIKITDMDKDGNPTLLGEGTLPLEKFIGALGEMNYTGWIVYEYPKLWQTSDDGRDANDILTHAADTLYQWMAATPARC